MKCGLVTKDEIRTRAVARLWASSTTGEGIQRTYSLAERSALADGDLVTLLDTEGRRDVRRQVLVSLLVTGILGDEVEVFASDDEGSVHLGRNDSAG